jgi:hypothetical protein
LVVLGSSFEGQPPLSCQLPVVLQGALQERREFDVRKLRLAGLGHGKQIAQQRIQPAHLLQDCFERGYFSRVIA